jgi:hypothetical protein
MEKRGFILDMEVISTVEKDREYVQGCRTEYAYLILLGVLRTPQAPASEWYESAKSNAVAYDFNTTDDIPADGQPVKIFEIFMSEGYSIYLVLKAVEASQHRRKRAYRCVGICNIPSDQFKRTLREEIIII